MTFHIPKPAKKFVIRHPTVSTMTLFVCITILMLQIIQLTKG